MAVHSSIPSMLRESLIETIVIADYCINSRKNRDIWGTSGCYGYPGAVLLFSIVDSIGSYVLGVNVRNHFNILNHKDFYNLNLSEEELNIVYSNYRCLLTHNSVMPVNHILNMGAHDDKVFEIKNGIPIVNVLPFLNLNKQVLQKFLDSMDETIAESEVLKMILNK